jgi:hypothetical protein
MAEDHLSAIGLEARKDSDKHFARFLMLCGLLLISHFLRIRPGEIEAAGVKIELANLAVLRGALALVLLYYFYSMCFTLSQGSLLTPLSELRVTRQRVRLAKIPFRDGQAKKTKRRTPGEVKRYVRIRIAVFGIFIAPFVIVVILVSLFGLLFAVYDTYQFGYYAFLPISDEITNWADNSL